MNLKIFSMNLIKNRLLLLVLLFSSLFFTNCRKEEPKPVIVDCIDGSRDMAAANQLIIGQWKWIETRFITRTGEWAETPASTGTTRKVVFKADGTVDFYSNDTLNNSRNYQIKADVDDLYVEYEKLDSAGVFGADDLELCKNSLVLTNIRISESGNEVYQRID